MRSVFWLVLTGFLCLAACSDPLEKQEKNIVPSYIIYSPNGEPLNGGALGKPTCEKALSGWFVRMAGSDAGTISKNTFITDARTQFARMDIDHNGFLVSEELDRFRAPYRQEPEATKPDAEKGEHKARGRKGNKAASDKKADASPAQLFDPVMSADANLDFRVTLDEFMAQAQDNFSKLDNNHDNLLNKEEITATCKVEEKY